MRACGCKFTGWEVGYYEWRPAPLAVPKLRRQAAARMKVLEAQLELHRTTANALVQKAWAAATAADRARYAASVEHRPLELW